MGVSNPRILCLNHDDSVINPDLIYIQKAKRNKFSHLQNVINFFIKTLDRRRVTTGGFFIFFPAIVPVFAEFLRVIVMKVSTSHCYESLYSFIVMKVSTSHCY